MHKCGGNPDWEYWEYYEYKEGDMAAREPWAVEVPENMALEPAALKQRGSAVTRPRACHAEMGATRPQDCGTRPYNIRKICQQG